MGGLVIDDERAQGTDPPSCLRHIIGQYARHTPSEVGGGTERKKRRKRMLKVSCTSRCRSTPWGLAAWNANSFCSALILGVRGCEGQVSCYELVHCFGPAFPTSRNIEELEERRLCISYTAYLRRVPNQLSLEGYELPVQLL